MIIVCPACETRYDLPESAIGPEGRTVRCAQCRHSWFQPGPVEEAADAPVADDAAPDGDIPAAESAVEAPAPGAPAPFAAMDDLPPEDAFAPLPEENDYGEAAARARRRQAWLWLLALFVLFAAVIGGALAWYGAPDWLPFRHTALATSTRTGLALDFPARLIERTTLPDGTELFRANGTVTNTGTTRRDVPPIEIVLRDANRHVVYRWDIMPPKGQLGPGERMTITQAITDIPRDAQYPEIGWKAG